MKRRFGVLTLVALGLAILAGVYAAPRAQQAQAVQVDADDIGGVVTGRNGPEAGVWVIAETTDLPTKFAKIVVTDDRGRYLLPDLPKAQLQRLGARLRPRRLPEGAGHARRSAEPDGRRRAQRRARRRSTTRRATGGRCCRSRRRASFPAPARQRQRHLAEHDRARRSGSAA